MPAEIKKFATKPSIRQYLYSKLKRILDVAMSFIALVLLLPLWCLVALCLYVAVREIPWYKTQHIENGHSLFYLLHIREYSEYQYGAWVAFLSRFMHISAVRYVPHLLAIFCGQMSFIGVSLCAVSDSEDVRAYYRWDCIRQKPGLLSLSCFLPVHHRSVTEKRQLDYLYMKGLSLKNDIRLLCLWCKQHIKQSIA